MNLQPEDSRQQQQRFRVGFWVLMALALFYLLTEHRAHFLGALPYLLLLACPLMHLFMRRGHGRHSHGEDRNDNAGGEKREEKQP